MEELLTNLASVLALVGGIAVVLRKTVLEIQKVIIWDRQSPDMGDEVPDESEEVPDLSEEDLSDILGSEALHIKNQSFDEKIARLRSEVARPGEIYEEDHAVVDALYIPKPNHEYAE